MNALLIPLCLGILAVQTAPADNPCDPLKLRPWYGPLEDEEVLSVKLLGELPDSCPAETRLWSESQAFFFLQCSSPGDNRVVLSTGNRLFQFSSEERPWRPIRARWINEKLLYLELSWNPHAGAYWVFDVDKERIVVSERWLEDILVLQRCYGRKDDQPDEGANRSSPNQSLHRTPAHVLRAGCKLRSSG